MGMDIESILLMILTGMTTWVLTTVLRLRDRVLVIETKVVDVLIRAIERHDKEIDSLRRGLEDVKDTVVECQVCGGKPSGAKRTPPRELS